MPSAPSPTASSRVPAGLRRVIAWLPSEVDARVRVFAWLSFVAEVLIIGTGGAVRLTGSGLGCPTWPRCTPDSLVNTPEMGIHGIIEFGNRTLTGLVGILALAVVVLVWRMRKERRALFVLALVVLGGIVAQAVVGGITVLVAVCAAFLVLMHQPIGPRSLAVPRWFAGLVHATTAVLALTIVFGVLTTGAGPHSGDAAAGRNGFDAEVLEHVHAWPGYTLFALTLVVVVIAWRLRLPVRRWASALLAVELVQIAVGLYQARNGLPEIAVGTHMVLAALTAATMTVVVLRMKQPTLVDGSLPRRETASARR